MHLHRNWVAVLLGLTVVSTNVTAQQKYPPLSEVLSHKKEHPVCGVEQWEPVRVTSCMWSTEWQGNCFADDAMLTVGRAPRFKECGNIAQFVPAEGAASVSVQFGQIIRFDGLTFEDLRSLAPHEIAEKQLGVSYDVVRNISRDIGIKEQVEMLEDMGISLAVDLCVVPVGAEKCDIGKKNEIGKMPNVGRRYGVKSTTSIHDFYERNHVDLIAQSVSDRLGIDSKVWRYRLRNMPNGLTPLDQAIHLGMIEMPRDTRIGLNLFYTLIDEYNIRVPDISANRCPSVMEEHGITPSNTSKFEALEWGRCVTSVYKDLLEFWKKSKRADLLRQLDRYFRSETFIHDIVNGRAQDLLELVRSNGRPATFSHAVRAVTTGME